MCDMTHSYVWHVSSIRGTWHIHTWGLTLPYVAILILISFVDLFCGSLLWVSFVGLFCGSLLWVSFVGLFCGSLLWYVAILILISDRTDLYVTCHAFLEGYCSTVQGLRDWFEVDLGFPELVVFRLNCVFCVFLFCIPSRSPLVLFGHPLSCHYTYGVAAVSRIDKIIGLFCKRAL